MTTFAVEPQGQLIDAAKQAAIDAVAGYERLTRYTIGVAVQAAAAVLRSDFHPPSARLVRDAWDVPSIEVAPRLRALETVAEVARRSHDTSAHAGGECTICAALRHLDQAV